VLITNISWSAYQFAINRRSLPGNYRPYLVCSAIWSIFTARCYAKRGTCRRRVSVRPSVYVLQYQCLNVCINSGDDVAISCKDLVNLCRVTPEIMELILERQVRHAQKASIFNRISPDILD